MALLFSSATTGKKRRQNHFCADVNAEDELTIIFMMWFSSDVVCIGRVDAYNCCRSKATMMLCTNWPTCMKVQCNHWTPLNSHEVFAGTGTANFTANDIMSLVKFVSFLDFISILLFLLFLRKWVGCNENEVYCQSRGVRCSVENRLCAGLEWNKTVPCLGHVTTEKRFNSSLMSSFLPPNNQIGIHRLIQSTKWNSMCCRLSHFIE